jgi:hypothetical protein
MISSIAAASGFGASDSWYAVKSAIRASSRFATILAAGYDGPIMFTDYNDDDE